MDRWSFLQAVRLVVSKTTAAICSNGSIARLSCKSAQYLRPNGTRAMTDVYRYPRAKPARGATLYLNQGSQPGTLANWEYDNGVEWTPATSLPELTNNVILNVDGTIASPTAAQAALIYVGSSDSDSNLAHNGSLTTDLGVKIGYGAGANGTITVSAANLLSLACLKSPLVRAVLVY